MPLYEYRCESCGRTHEVLQRLDDPPLTTCPDCGGVLRKQISAPAFQFKGTGWYVTDYAKSGSGGGARSSDGGTKAAEPAKSESAAPAAPAGGDKPSPKSD